MSFAHFCGYLMQISRVSDLIRGILCTKQNAQPSAETEQCRVCRNDRKQFHIALVRQHWQRLSLSDNADNVAVPSCSADKTSPALFP
ncbi:MAG: hypothetical protein WBD16_08250 [Pyrinomonadaceae bacterium]